MNDETAFDNVYRLRQPVATQSLGGSLEQNPDDVAKAFNYSKATGMDPTIIHDNLEDFEKDYKRGLGSVLLEGNDAVTNFINKHPLHAGLIHDDLGEVDQATQSYKKFGDTWQDYRPSHLARTFAHNVIQGAKEGFGEEPLGKPKTLETEPVSPEWEEWAKDPAHKLYLEDMLKLRAFMGMPVEAFMRSFGAGIGAIRGVAGKDVAGMVEMEVMGLGGRGMGTHPPQGINPFRKPPEVPKLDPGKIGEEVSKLRPYFEAGEEPPPGVSEFWDGVREKRAKDSQAALADAVGDADATKLKVRSPEKLRELLSELPEVQLRISGDAVRKLYGDKVPEPEDGILGWVPNLQAQLGHSEITVSSHDLVSHIDKQIFDALKDDISTSGDMTVNETKELAEHKKLTEEPERQRPKGVPKSAEYVGDNAKGQEIWREPPSDEYPEGRSHVYLEDRDLTAHETNLVKGPGIGRGDRNPTFVVTEHKKAIEPKAAEEQSAEEKPIHPVDPAESALASTRQGAGFVPERIVSAAMSDGKITVQAPNHFQAAEEAVEKYGQDAYDWEQGFVTSHGRFVDRYEALEIAQNSEQFKGIAPDLESGHIGLDQGPGKYGKTEPKAAPTGQITLEKTRTHTDWGGDEQHIYNLNINGQRVGGLNLSKKGDGLYINWVGLDDDFAPGYEELGPEVLYNQLGPRVMRNVLNQLRDEFPEARFIEGMRIGGARAKFGGKTDVEIPLKSRPAREGEPEFDRQQDVQQRYGTQRLEAIMDEALRRDTGDITQVGQELRDFLLDRILGASGETPVTIVPWREFPSERLRQPYYAGYFDMDNRTGERHIYMSQEWWNNRPDELVEKLLHEGAHDFTLRQLYEDPKFAEDTAYLMNVVRDEVKGMSKRSKGIMEYGLQDVHEFLAEGFSNPEFQRILQKIELPSDVVRELGLDRPYKATLWDAFVEHIRRLIENFTGIRFNTYTALEGILRQGERAEGFREAERDRVRESGFTEPFKIHPDALKIQKLTDEPLQQPAKSEGPFEEGKAIGRTQAELSKYEKLIAKRDAEDVAWRLRRAERQAQLENSKEWKAESEKIRPGIERAIESRPEVAVWRFFQNKKFLNQELSAKPKFAKDSLTPEQLAAIPEGFVGKKGMHPDDVANLFGFDSGDAVIRALNSLNMEAEGGPKGGDIVKRIVDAEVYRRLSDRLGQSAQDRLDEAKDHALGMTQMEMLAERVVAFGMEAGIKTPISKTDMDYGARKLLNEKTFGGMKSDKLLAEAGKASRTVEKALLDGKPSEAFKAAQDHYIFSRMAKEARKVEQEKKVFDRQAKRYQSREVGGATPEYTNWIHDILIRLGKNVDRSERDLQTEIASHSDTTLQSFLDTKDRMGLEIYVPDFLVDQSDPRYKMKLEDLNVGDARQAMAAVRSLAKNSIAEKKIGREGAKRDLRDFITRAITRLETLERASEPSYFNPHKFGRLFLAHTLQLESIFNRWDRGNAFGIFNNDVMRPLASASNYRDALSKEFAKKYLAAQDKEKLNEKIPNDIFKDPQGALTVDPNTGYVNDWANAAPIPFTRKNLRSVILNMGNEDNLSRLAGGYGLTPEAVRDWAFKNSKKEDWDWAQRMGDVFKELKGHSDRMYRRLSGVAPEAVNILPIDTPFGKYDGWYYPIIHDPLVSGGLEKTKIGGPILDNTYIKAGTPSGYTKSRTRYVGPLSLMLDAIPQRIYQEIHDIAFREAVTDASKVFYHKDFLNAVTKNVGKDYKDLLIPWLKNVANSANGVTALDHAFATYSEFARQNIIGTLIGFNPYTVLKHGSTALINSITEVGGRDFVDAFFSLLRNGPEAGESNWAFVHRKSDEVARRSQHFVENVRGAHEVSLGLHDTSTISGKLLTFRDAMQYAQTSPVRFFDLLSTVPTWLATYRREVAKGTSEGDAIYLADRSVRRTHGSTAITNRPAIMQGSSQLTGWITSLYGFFNHIANRQYELAWMAKDSMGAATRAEVNAGLASGIKGTASAAITIGLFSYVILPALVEEYFSPLEQDPHKREKEGWGKWAFKGLARGLSSSWVGVRDVVNAALTGHDPAIGLTSTYGKEYTDLLRDVERKNFGFDREHAGKTYKHLITMFGAATGVTNAEEGNVAEFLYNLHVGKEHPKNMKDWWRGLTKGQTKGAR